MKFENAEKYRAPHPLGIPNKKGDDYGWFRVPSPYHSKPMAVMVAPSDSEWQHVSVSLPNRCPNWPEMCLIKELFWDEEDTVIQFHPPKSEYVNQAEHCLHLWRWTKGTTLLPPNILVGVKN